MPPSLLRESATLADEPTVERERIKRRPTARLAPMSSFPKKPVKGGGKAKRPPKKRGRKKKKVAEIEESSDESLIVSDIKNVPVDDYPEDDSADDAGVSSGGESDVSEYKDTRPVAKRAAGKGTRKKGVSSKAPAPKKTTAVGRAPVRKVYTRKSAAADPPKKGGRKSTLEKKGKAMVENTPGENSMLPDDSEDGYNPDEEDDENNENRPNASRTPAKRAAKKVADKSVKKGTSGKTPRKTVSGKRLPAKVTGKAVAKPSPGGGAPIVSESEHEQEGESSNTFEVVIVPTKRKAPDSGGNRPKKVAKTAAGKKIAAIECDLESLAISSADENTDENTDEDTDSNVAQAGGSVGGSSPIQYNRFIIKGGTAEQRAAISAAYPRHQTLSSLQSEPVIGEDRLRYGGKSVSTLQEMWKRGLPKHDSD